MQVNLLIRHWAGRKKKYFRYGQMVNADEDNWNVISYILTLLRPLEWDVFTEVFEKVSRSRRDQTPTDCRIFQCEECLRLPW